MRKLRTRHFKIALFSVSAVSALFLLLFGLFGKTFAAAHFQGALDCMMSIMALAAGSFLAFSFLPYFKGDRRWYSISALLTLVFFAGATMLWQMPIAGGVIG